LLSTPILRVLHLAARFLCGMVAVRDNNGLAPPLAGGQIEVRLLFCDEIGPSS